MTNDTIKDQGGTATAASPADAMNEALAASLGRQLMDRGVDTSALEEGDLVKIVAHLGDQASQAAMRLLGLDPKAGAPGPRAPLPEPSSGFYQPRYGRSSFGPPVEQVPGWAPSPDESFSLGDTPNGDFPAGGQAGTPAIDAGVFDRLAVEQRQARVDTFKAVVSGGLHMLSDWLESRAARLLVGTVPPVSQADRHPIGFSPPLGGSGQAPHHTTPPFMSLRAGAAQRPLSEWVEVDPGLYPPPVDETGFRVADEPRVLQSDPKPVSAPGTE